MSNIVYSSLKRYAFECKLSGLYIRKLIVILILEIYLLTDLDNVHHMILKLFMEIIIRDKLT